MKWSMREIERRENENRSRQLKKRERQKRQVEELELLNIDGNQENERQGGRERFVKRKVSGLCEYFKMYISFNFRSYAPLIHSTLVFIPRFLCNYSMYVLLLYIFPHFHSNFIPYLSDFISSLRLLLLPPLLKFFNLLVLFYFPSFLDLCD